MPFFKCNSGLVYFYHVPKCGGSSIEKALLNKGFKLSFYDIGFWSKIDKCYYKSSPQHITTKDFNSLFAEDIFFYKFALVRDPVSRLLSAYAFNRKKIGYLISFNNFLSNLEKNVASTGDYFGRKYDNHFVPSSRLVAEDCNVFYLEKGMKELEVELSKKLQIKIDLSQKDNVGRYESSNPKTIKNLAKRFLIPQSPRIDDISEKVVSRIKNLYSEDYKRFNFK